MNFEKLKINNVYSNEDIKNAFNCSGQGGIRVSNKNKTITLISSLTKRNGTNPYQDKQMNAEGFVVFTGTGSIGDQKINGLNKRVAESNFNGYRLFYFEVYKNKEYTFKGEVILTEKAFFEKEPDSNNNIRKVVKFKLRLKKEEDIVYVSEEALEEAKCEEEKKIKKLSSSELAKSAIYVNTEPRTTKVVSDTYNRDLKVKQYTLRRAQGVCDLCEQPAPFTTKSGEAYLESHHVVPLAKKGKDSIINTVALCPNCHRLMHYGKSNKQNLLRLKEKLRSYIENDLNIPVKSVSELIKEYKSNFNIKD